MTLAFIGHGYVGLVTASVFSDLGNTVWVVGRTPSKIANLKKGIVPFYEPGLAEVVRRNTKAGRLIFTLSYDEAIPPSDIVFICVGTPARANGEADLSSVFEAAEKIGKNLDGYTVVVTKSTVPVGTNRQIRQTIAKVKPKKSEFDITSVPEFLREGTALADTLHPDRIVIGTDSERARKLLFNLHKPIDGHFVFTNIETAETSKYAANAMLSTKISFANAIAFLCERTGADVKKVLDGVGLDRRIGRDFLYPGVGFGGSCFPKDVKALIAKARDLGYNFSLLAAVDQINRQAKDFFIAKAIKLLGGSVKGKTVGVLGLSFKPNTDDLRDAPSLDIIATLKKKGAKIRAYDPAAMENANAIFKDIFYCKDPYEVANGADILLIITEWNEFKELDLLKIKKAMKNPILLDGRNMYEPDMVRSLGFTYQGVGR